MTRIVSIGSAMAAAIAALALAGAAQAQTYGQPYSYRAPTTYGQPQYQGQYQGYGRNYGHVSGYSYGYAGVGTPLSEVETRSYVQTGRYADGYSHGSPEQYGYGYRYGGYSPTHGYGHGYQGHSQSYYGDRGGRYGYSHDRRYRENGSRPAPGYRDEYGYNDDRPPSYSGSYRREDRRHDGHDGYRCNCQSDVYYTDTYY